LRSGEMHGLHAHALRNGDVPVQIVNEKTGVSLKLVAGEENLEWSPIALCRPDLIGPNYVFEDRQERVPLFDAVRPFLTMVGQEEQRALSGECRYQFLGI